MRCPCGSAWSTRRSPRRTNGAYQAAVRYLKAAKKAATAAEALTELEVRVAGLRETHRRRSSLIMMLDKAGFI
jgi:uncharacterized Zn finger protein